MKQVLILLYTSFIVVATSAQQTVKGKITDREIGAAIAGATISVNGATNITQTNKQGNFILHADTSLKVITVSFVGYETQKIFVPSDTKFLRIEMVSSSANLNEVIVTAYESNRKLFQTAGAISLLTKRDIQGNSQTDMLPILNTVPGVKMEEEAPGDFKINCAEALCVILTECVI